MVTKAWGVANGKTVIFTRTEGDRWEVSVPWTDDGEYVVEINAEDDAGNRAYLCTLLFVISGHEVKIHVVPRGYQGTHQNSGYAGAPEAPEYHADVEKGGFTIERYICGRDDL